MIRILVTSFLVVGEVPPGNLHFLRQWPEVEVVVSVAQLVSVNENVTVFDRGQKATHVAVAALGQCVQVIHEIVPRWKSASSPALVQPVDLRVMKQEYRIVDGAS